MAAIKDLARRKIHGDHELQASGVWNGRVVPPVPVYPNERQLLWVTFDDIDPNTKWQAFWSLRTMDSLVNIAEVGEVARDVHLSTPVWPIVGSKVIATWDNQGNLWVLEWW